MHERNTFPGPADAAWPLPRSLRETFAEALRVAEIELRDAQVALGLDDSDMVRHRYAAALTSYRNLQEAVPLVVALKVSPES